MSIAFIIFVFVLIFVFIVMNKAKEIARTNEEWMRTAGKLKLAFKKAGGILETPRLGGEIDNLPVSVYVNMEKRGDKIVPFTTYSVTLPEGCGIESVLDKASNRVESVRTGHPLVDKLLSAGGFDRAKLREMMSEAKEAAIAKFSKACPNISVSDSRIVCKFEGVDSDADMIHSRISQLVRLAKMLSWQAGGEAAGGQLEKPEPPEMLSLAPVEPAPQPRKTLERSARKPEERQQEEAPKAAPAPTPAAQHFGESKHATNANAASEVRRVSESRFATNANAASEVRQATNAKPAGDSKMATEAKQIFTAAAAASPSQDFDCSLNPEPLAKALFSNPLPGQAEKALFERLKGTQVSWSGTLKMAQEYGMDFNFPGGAGSKAVFEVCEVSGSSSSLKLKIRAVVQLPKDASQGLKSKIGQSASFKGTLFKCEPFAKEIYVSNGSLT